MTPQASIRVLHVLLIVHLVLFVGASVEEIIHVKNWDTPLTTGETIISIAALPALIAYLVGLVGLWLRKTWGLVAFGLFELVVLLPPLNDPSSTTKLSLSLGSANMLVAGLILGLTVFAMQDEFRSARRRTVPQVFS